MVEARSLRRRYSTAEKFKDEKAPSDKKLKKIFGDGPGIVEKQMMHRAWEPQVELLAEYRDWLGNTELALYKLD